MLDITKRLIKGLERNNRNEVIRRVIGEFLQGREIEFEGTEKREKLIAYEIIQSEFCVREVYITDAEGEKRVRSARIKGDKWVYYEFTNNC